MDQQGERPIYLSPIAAGIPEELKAIPRWVNWRGIHRDQWTKPPLRPDGKPADVSKSETWSVFPVAWSAFESGSFDGVGFVLNGDGIVGLDFDKCRCPAFDGVDESIAGGLNMVLPEIAERIRGLNAYTEVSPSKRGVHVFLKGTLPVTGKRKGHIEVYQSGRYFTITGRPLDGFPLGIEDRSAELSAFYTDVFGKEKKAAGPLAPSAPVGDWQDRLDRAFASKNGAEIKKLWDGDTRGNHSEADLALMAHLAFWLGGDRAAMDAAFRASKLMRKKWDEKHSSDGRTYGQMTTEKALEGCRSFYGERVRVRAEGPETDEEPDILQALARNEDGDAELFIRLHRDDLVFDHSSGLWYRWKGNYWERDSTEESLAGVSDVCEIYSGEMKRQALIRINSEKAGEKEKATAAKKIEDALSRRIRDLQVLRRKEDVIHLAKAGGGSLGISGEEWDKDPWVLPVRNGVINLRTGDLRPGVPRDFFKTFAPTEWRGLDASCPLWEKFLHEVFNGDTELIAFMNRLLGYSVAGLTVEHILLMLWGIGRNGKGTLIEIIGYVLGPIAGQGDPELILDGRFNRISGAPSSDIMALRGKRLVWVSEMSEGRRLSPGRVKWLTGGDTLTGREVRGKRQVSFTPMHTLFLLTNSRPRANAEDFALWSRVHLIPFELSFVAEPDPEKPNERPADLHLLEKLKAETSGILAWLVRGCLAWQRKGLKPPPLVRIATTQYRENEDIIRRFIQERCATGPSYSVRGGFLYEAYVQWAKKNDELTINNNEFGKYMAKTFSSKKDENGRLYFGIRLL